MGSDIDPADPSSSDLTDANDVPSHVQIDDYGYGSDSDLDDDDEVPSISLIDIKKSKDESTTVSATPPQISVTTLPKDDDE